MYYRHFHNKEMPKVNNNEFLDELVEHYPCSRIMFQVANNEEIIHVNIRKKYNADTTKVKRFLEESLEVFAPKDVEDSEFLGYVPLWDYTKENLHGTMTCV